MVFRGAKIIRKGNEWFVYITVEREVEGRNPKSILAIDMGARRMAATVNSNSPKPKFYGKGLRRVKGHYFWLRRTLALNEAYKTIKKIGCKERRVVDDILHKVGRATVNGALASNSMTVLGDLKGIRRNGKGSTTDSHTTG